MYSFTHFYCFHNSNALTFSSSVKMCFCYHANLCLMLVFTMQICEKTQIRMSGILFSLLFMRPGKQVGDSYIKDVTEFLKSFWQMLLTSF